MYFRYVSPVSHSEEWGHVLKVHVPGKKGDTYPRSMSPVPDDQNNPIPAAGPLGLTAWRSKVRIAR